MLTEDEIEAAIGKGQFQRAPLLPLDVESGFGGSLASNGEHGGVRVEAGHPTRRAHERRGGTSHNTAAAGNVEHLCPGRNFHRGEHLSRQRRKDGRDEPIFVERRWVSHREPSRLTLTYVSCPYGTWCSDTLKETLPDGHYQNTGQFFRS